MKLSPVFAQFAWFALAASLVPSAVPSAAAGEVFAYPPSPAGGVLVSSWVALDGSDSDTYAYNEFVLPATESITEVRWRGGYKQGAPFGKAYQFTITFFATNITGFEPLIVTLPDCEGEPSLANYQVIGNAGETPAGSIGGTAVYDYHYVLPTPFVATGGVKYWIRIVAWQPVYPDWGPTAGTGGNGSHFHYSTGSHMFSFWPGDTSFSLVAAWKDLGSGLAGTKGVPVLTGTGGFTSNAAGALTLTNARSNATAYLIVGASAIDAPLYGGLLVPAPSIVAALPTGSAGKIALPFTLPAGVPAGASVYVQYWITDPAAVEGFAASNALRATTY